MLSADIRPKQDLPLSPQWNSTDEYVQSLLKLVTSSDLFRNLCGGVHVLDFLTRKPDLYSWVLPEDWRVWFDLVSVDDLLDLLLREDLTQFEQHDCVASDEETRTWREVSFPPASLVAYISTIRLHALDRSFTPVSQNIEALPRHVAVGMKPKKVHEVVNFAAYVDQLSSSISQQTQEPLPIIDFGSGQNYLGRTLASPPYEKHVIAIEQRHHNVEGARGMDVLARLSKKEKNMVNKKEYKRQLAVQNGMPTPPTEAEDDVDVSNTPVAQQIPEVPFTTRIDPTAPLDPNKGSMTYVEHELVDGHLEGVLYMKDPSVQSTANSAVDASHTSSPSRSNRPKSIVVSIHSCGNLTHHGIRSVTLNPSVRAVAMIGCCYNLLTERLGPATYKHPQLRPNHPRLEATSSTYDPHGFPMSKRLEEFEYTVNSQRSSSALPPPATTNDKEMQKERGVRLNITARMMAVQAPYNWGPIDSRAFFTRHFYRALLQRILLDHGVVKQPEPSSTDAAEIEVVGGSLTGKDEQGTPLIIGSLRKSAFTSFPNYVAAALEKLWADPVDGPMIKSRTAVLLDNPSTIQSYQENYAYAEKHLAIIWSLMAFSAGVVESVIVVDRWLWLQEQEDVAEAWVQTVFDYKQSPRNLCVIGVKKGEGVQCSSHENGNKTAEAA